MSTKLSVSVLRSLKVGARLLAVYKHGSEQFRHPAKLVEHGPYFVGILIYFTDQPQQKIRWSFATNKPVRQSRGFLGDAWLELAADD